jgi:hypothetical protein
MRWPSAQHSNGRQRRYVPLVESLEERQLLAVNFIVNGTTLFIKGGTTPNLVENERIVINDDGSNNPNNITVSTATAPFHPNVPITSVMLQTGAGNDRITYNLTGDLVGSRLINASMGRGNDHFNATLRRNLLPNSSLSILARGQKGTDHLQATLIGSVATKANLQLNFDGGPGQNFLNVLSTNFVTVQDGASVGLVMTGAGPSASDQMFIQYAGRLDGTLGLTALGGDRDVNNITVGFDLLTGSRGTVLPGSLVRGGHKSDNINFVVHYPATAQANNLVLDGGAGGTDICSRTTNVSTVNCTVDNVVP